MVASSSELIRLSVALSDGFGPGIMGYKTWIATGVVVLILAAVAWWATRPAGRPTRTHPKSGVDGSGR